MKFQLLLAVGTKLEHIITCLAQDAAEKPTDGQVPKVKPSDHHFWFNQPGILLYLIHFILFQNAFELAYFFWIIVSIFNEKNHIYPWSELILIDIGIRRAPMDFTPASWKKLVISSPGFLLGITKYNR